MLFPACLFLMRLFLRDGFYGGYSVKGSADEIAAFARRKLDARDIHSALGKENWNSSIKFRRKYYLSWWYGINP